MAGFTLVPSEFFSSEDVHKILSEVVPIKDTDIVRHIELPDYKAVLVYVRKSADKSDFEPPIADLLRFAPTISGHNRLAVFLDKKTSTLYWLKEIDFFLPMPILRQTLLQLSISFSPLYESFRSIRG